MRRPYIKSRRVDFLAQSPHCNEPKPSLAYLLRWYTNVWLKCEFREWIKERAPRCKITIVSTLAARCIKALRPFSGALSNFPRKEMRVCQVMSPSVLLYSCLQSLKTPAVLSQHIKLRSALTGDVALLHFTRKLHEKRATVEEEEKFDLHPDDGSWCPTWKTASPVSLRPDRPMFIFPFCSKRLPAIINKVYSCLETAITEKKLVLQGFISPY